jgi:FkbM family methyltransferase
MATLPSPLEIARRVHECAGIPRGTSIALDVGAHVGIFSKELLDSGLFAEVIAFEPSVANLGALSALREREPKLAVVRAAVSATPGERDFFSDRNTSTGSLLGFRAGYATDGAVRKTRVGVTTIDEYRARSHPAARVGLLKTDTQGQDLAVLQGAKGMLASDRPVVIAEMIYLPMYEGQAGPEEILAAMRATRYGLHALFNIHATVEGRLAFADALFVPLEYDVPLSQQYVQLDNHASYLSQIGTLERICRERLDVINMLDAEVKRLAAAKRADA